MQSLVHPIPSLLHPISSLIITLGPIASISIIHFHPILSLCHPIPPLISKVRANRPHLHRQEGLAHLNRRCLVQEFLCSTPTPHHCLRIYVTIAFADTEPLQSRTITSRKIPFHAVYSSKNVPKIQHMHPATFAFRIPKKDYLRIFS